jgi:hypothetical protein
METQIADQGIGELPRRRPATSGTNGGGAGRRPLLRSFGEFLDYFLTRTDTSQGRAAQLSGLYPYTINKVLHGHGVSEAVMLRIVIGLLQLPDDQLDFINLGLASAGCVAVPIPGRTIPSHEDHARMKRGSVRGKRFGNRATEAARERNGPHP